MKIEAVTFDVGGTLLEPWPSVGHVYARVGQDHGLGKLNAAAVNQAFTHAWKERDALGFDYSKSSWQTLVNCVFRRLTDEPTSTELFDDLYHTFAGRQAWRLTEDLKPLWDDLRGKGLKLGIISNWDDRLRPLLGEMGLLDSLDAVVISSETTWTKPAPEIFQEEAGQLGVSLDRLLHVGDSRREDFEGARQAGCQAAWLRRGVSGLVWPEISGLAELQQWVRI